MDINSVKNWFKENGIGRDTFIRVISKLKTMDRYYMPYRGKTVLFEKQDWMDEVKSPRQFYEDIVLGDLKGVSIEDFIVDKFIHPDMTMSEDTDVPLSDILLVKENQRLKDKVSRLNKFTREDGRKLIKIEDTLLELKDAISKLDIRFPIQREIDLTGIDKVGIMQLSDLHLNEIINESNNKFDFNIASSRLRYFTQTTIKRFLDNGVTSVYLFGSGDFLNSNRRSSEKINSATSRVHATMVAVKLLINILKDLSEHFDVKVAMVSSNESRIEKDMEFDELSASENFDIIIYNILKLTLLETDIKFIDCDYVEGIVNISEFNKNILLTHGAQFSDAGLQKKIQELRGKYASRGILLSYVFFGDKHATRIEDKHSRSASLSGGNGYSDLALGFDSTASQNNYIMYKNGSVSGCKVDLQYVHSEGYDITNEIKKYNIKGLTRYAN